MGRALFAAANCQSCYGGVNWTRSVVDFTPPPLATETITGGQLGRLLRNVGTFDPGAFNEVRPNVVTANGAAGFNVPSLLSVIAGAPYLHSGSALTLDEVLNNVTHRSAGTPGVDTLSNSEDRQALVGFLKTIDEQTLPFPYICLAAASRLPRSRASCPAVCRAGFAVLRRSELPFRAVRCRPLTTARMAGGC